MEPAVNIYTGQSFNEDEWLKLIFLLSDTQNWLNDMVKGAMLQVPIKERRKLFRKSYYITVNALAHILERHHYKIPRHPHVSKFTIPVVNILAMIRDAANTPGEPMPDTIYLSRLIDTGKIIGHDFNGHPTSLLTILTDSAGRIITAFPGRRKEQTSIQKL